MNTTSLENNNFVFSNGSPKSVFTLHGQETDVFSFNPVNNINKDLFKTHQSSKFILFTFNQQFNMFQEYLKQIQTSVNRYVELENMMKQNQLSKEKSDCAIFIKELTDSIAQRNGLLQQMIYTVDEIIAV